MTDAIVDHFAALFRGNEEAFGTEEGGCDRCIGDEWDHYELRIEKHLSGLKPMGVYPMVHDFEGWRAKWGCVDFDEGEDESWVHARNVQLLLAELGVQAHIERSRSKGYHVWVFLAEWTDAKVVREALLAACQMVDAPTKEINPKASELEPGQLGNYVRLPYPGALSTGDTDNGRRMMVFPVGRHPMHLEEWLDSVELVEQTPLDTLQSMYQPPIRKRKRTLNPSDWALKPTDQLTPYLRKVYEGGPLEEEVDRSAALWRFVCLLAESGKVDEEAAVELATSWDERWLGKFSERSDGERRISEIVGKAYG